MNKTFTIFFILIFSFILFSLTFISSFNFQDKLYGLDRAKEVISFNNNSGSVNSSQYCNYWDNLNTPNDIEIDDLKDVYVPTPYNYEVLTWVEPLTKWMGAEMYDLIQFKDGWHRIVNGTLYNPQILQFNETKLNLTIDNRIPDVTNKLNKTGDTMTGNFTLNNSKINIQDVSESIRMYFEDGVLVVEG